MTVAVLIGWRDGDPHRAAACQYVYGSRVGDVDATEVIDEWRRVGATDDRAAAIHPAGGIDEATYRQSGRDAALDVVRLIADHGDREPALVVDYGCGDGRVAHELARIEPAWQVVGVDASPEMVDAFDARGAAIGSTALGMTWHTGAGTPSPVAGADAVYAYAVLIHHGWVDGAAMIAGLADVARVGGLVLVDAPVYDEARERSTAHDVTTWTRPMLLDAARSARCEVVEVAANDGAFDWSTGPGPNHGRLHVLRRI